MLKVQVDFGPVYKWLSDIEKQQLPFAASLAMTRTAQFARKQIIAEMPRVFDRPKPSTTNELRGPLFVKTASKAKFPNDYAEVRVKDTPQAKGDPALAYLSHHIRGGARIEKRSEFLLRKAGILLPGYYAVPGEGARLNAYGNMSAGQIQQILSAVGAQRDSLANSRKRGGRNANQADYFLAYRGRAKTSHLAEGVWQRYGRNRFEIRPVLIFVRGAPRYKKRLRFFEMCEDSARMRFPREFHSAMKQALASAKVQRNPLAGRGA